MSGPRISRPDPDYVAGCKMPNEHSIVQADRERVEMMARGSAALLAAIVAYARKHQPGSRVARYGGAG